MFSTMKITLYSDSWENLITSYVSVPLQPIKICNNAVYYAHPVVHYAITNFAKLLPPAEGKYIIHKWTALKVARRNALPSPPPPPPRIDHWWDNTAWKSYFHGRHRFPWVPADLIDLSNISRAPKYDIDDSRSPARSRVSVWPFVSANVKR